MYNEAREGYY